MALFRFIMVRRFTRPQRSPRSFCRRIRRMGRRLLFRDTGRKFCSLCRNKKPANPEERRVFLCRITPSANPTYLLRKFPLGREISRLVAFLDFLHGQLHATTVVDIQHLHQNFLTFAQLVSHVLDAAIRDLGNVHQTILARQDVNEGTEVHNALNAALVDSAHFDLCGDFLDPVHCRLGSFLVVGVDLHVAVIIQIDGGAGFVTDRADNRAALTDNVTDLLRVDLDGGDARRAGRQFGTGGRNDLVHLAQDVQTRCVCLLKRKLHDLVGDAVDLDIHLQGGYALLSTGNLEIHIAQVIFVTQDVSQDRELVAFFDQTHGNTGYRRLDGYTGVHQCQAGATDRSHGAGTVGFSDLGNRTDGVGELFNRRHDRQNTTLGQATVTNFAATRCANTTSFTYGVRREVVVEQERILTLAFQRINDLHIAGGTQRGGHDGLGLATGKQGRTMNTGQNAHFNFDRTHGFVVATVNPRLAVDNLLAYNVFLDLSEVLFDFVCRRLTFLFAGQLLDGCGFDLTQALVTGHLVTDAIGFLDGAGELRLDRIQQFGIFLLRLPVPTRLADFCGKFLDGAYGRLHFLVTVQNTAQHLVFGEALGFRLNHQNRIFSAGNNHIQQGGLQLFEGRVQEVTALIGVAHTGRTNGAIERDTGDGKRSRSSQHRSDIRILVLAGGHNRGDDLNFVHEAVWEQRTNRTVDQAGGQGFLLGRTTFALEEATGDFAHGVGFLEVVHGQREERLAWLRFLGANNGTENGNIIHGYQYGTGCLTGNTAGFQSDGLAAKLK